MHIGDLYDCLYSEPITRPSFIAYYGVEDKSPLLICTLIHLISVALFLLMDQKVGDHSAEAAAKSNFSIIQFVKIAPGICGGILFFAFFDGTILSMFPIYGMGILHRGCCCIND